MHTGDDCPAKDKAYYNCDTVGHFGQVCRKPKRTKDARTNLVKVEEAHGSGSDPTCMMRGVKVTPRDVGTPFVFDMCPDTRCTQTLVSEDVVSCQDLVVNTLLRKRVRAVSNQKLDCSGTVVFNIEFEGRSKEVVALVSSLITSKVLLTWQVLQRLGVITDNFPNIDAMAAV